MPPSTSLTDALSRYELELDDNHVLQLERYCQLVWDWNRRLNLTRHTNYDTFVARDLIDSVALAGQLEPEETILDVGTGGGVPGGVLAILRPDLQVSLCDSVGKKARAVEAIVGELGESVPVHHARAELLLAETAYSTLVARAVGPMDKVLRWLKPHWNSIGRLLLVKGPRWVEERRVARHRGLLNDLQLRRVAEYAMPDTESTSVVLQLWPKMSGGQ